MRLDCFLAQEQPLADRKVRSPFSHQLENAALLVTKAFQSRPVPMTADEVFDDIGIDHRSARNDGIKGLAYDIDVCDSVFEQITEAFGAAHEQV